MWTVKFKKNRLFEKLCCLVEFEEYKNQIFGPASNQGYHLFQAHNCKGHSIILLIGFWNTVGVILLRFYGNTAYPLKKRIILPWLGFILPN